MARVMRAAACACTVGPARQLFLLACLLLAHAACPANAAELPALGVRIEETTVSGLSAGAYMAGQFQMAHARIVTGAGLIAGGPYGCAESTFADTMPGPGTMFLNAGKAVNGCMLDRLRMIGIPDPNHLARRARQLAEAGRIDPIEAVTRNRIYLFSGLEDHTVVPSIVAAARDFYVELGVPPSSIKHVTHIAAGHGFVTDAKGLACGKSGRPYVVACRYDQAGELLGFLLGPLKPRATKLSAHSEVFDQSPFAQGLHDSSLAESGMLYVPASCRSEPGCRVHIVFMGCGQNRNLATVVADLGYVPWADSNRLVVLFPQVNQNALNPQGCWDWWGYTGHEYLTRSGVQIVAVHRMLERLAGR